MNATGDKNKNQPLSATKRAAKKVKGSMNLQYHVRFVLRCIMFLLAAAVYFFDRNQYEILFSHFFEQFTFLHLIWFYLLIEMTIQSLPLPFMPTGCMKQFAFRYRPFSKDSKPSITEGPGKGSESDGDSETSSEKGEKIRLKDGGKAAEAARELLQTYHKRQNLRALIVLLVWFLTNSIWWILYIKGIFTEAECFLGTVLYIVFDLICILWFCPFQLFFMDTRCCSTCRIFNYGQIFTVTPILFVRSFASLSLIIPALLIFLLWEINLRLHPERFFEGTNAFLNCSHCTEKLCVSRNRFYRFFRIPLPGRKKHEKH